ncbi:prenyltransferase [Calidifontibacter terrae]
MAWLPEVPGVLSADQVTRTADFIAAHQDPNGSIPWFQGGELDPWDHVESAMGLAVAGRHDEALRALEWCARTQREDGSWPMRQVRGVVRDATADTNQCAYIAVGVWHHHLITGRPEVLARFWPTVERAINFVVRAQQPSGALAWAMDTERAWDTTALLTGSSSALQAIECACLIAQTLGHDRPRWRAAGRRLGDAVRSDPAAFADRSRFSMDWYYPVLSGAVRGEPAQRLIAAGWETFVWPDRGIRCVADQPWVTAAETTELVCALHAIGDDRAAVMLEQVQFLRDEETGGYWTGRNIPDDAVWPVEQTTWTAAAVLLAADALSGVTAGAGLFRDAGAWDGWGAREEAAS